MEELTEKRARFSFTSESAQHAANIRWHGPAHDDVVERKAITLTCNKDGKTVEIEIYGYVCGGLALHSSLGEKGGSSITHLRDSVAIYENIRHSHNFRLGILKEMAALTDWTRPYYEVANAMLNDPQLFERHKILIGKLHSGKEPSPCGRHHPTW